MHNTHLKKKVILITFVLILFIIHTYLSGAHSIRNPRKILHTLQNKNKIIILISFIKRGSKKCLYELSTKMKYLNPGCLPKHLIITSLFSYQYHNDFISVFRVDFMASLMILYAFLFLTEYIKKKKISDRLYKVKCTRREH